MIPSNDQVGAAVAALTGGTTVRVERQARWRPTWFVDVERDGALVPLVMRGDRFDTEAFPLHHEYTFHRVLAEHGIPVPHLHGYIEQLAGLDCFLMDRVPGKPTFDGVDDATRDVIVDEYLQQLARLHQLDPAPFIAAGITHPGAGEDAAMIGHGNMEQRYRDSKREPDAFAEFGIGWMRRHLPSANGRLSPIVWDSGQFHHHDGHLVSILDLEFGHIGDPMADITVWRMRDTLIPFGDMGKIYSRYEQLTGAPVDLETIKRHHFAAAIGNYLMFADAVLHPEPDTDIMTYMQWDSETNLMTTDFLLEYLGLEEPVVEVPAARVTRHDATFAHLVRALGTVKTTDPDLQHQLRLAFRTARHLQRRSEIGDELDAADIDDVHQLLGRRPADWFDAERALEGFVVADAATGRYDAELTLLFHKRNLRIHMALGPQGSSMTRHYQCQRFDGGPRRVLQL